MDHDDKQVGQILTRREILASMGAAGAAMVIGAGRPGRSAGDPASLPFQGPGCVVRPAQEEGPYFVDEKLNRSDIRSNPSDGAISAGTPLELTLRVSTVAGAVCAPAKGVLVDIWHCDALGVYSDEQDMNGRFDTRGKKFLRGYQVTDAKGVAKFTTIYPGWYEGRAIHIHFKLRTAPGSKSGKEFTSQLYFEESMNEQVLATLPYSTKGKGRLLNAADGIFRTGGKQLTLALAPAAKGYAGTFDIGLAS